MGIGVGAGAPSRGPARPVAVAAGFAPLVVAVPATLPHPHGHNPPAASAMESDVSQDFQDYWNECRIIQEAKRLDEYLDEEYANISNGKCFEEGEQEAEWLDAAGLSYLTQAYRRGQEIADSELDPAVRLLNSQQAEAVRRRVRSLNHTVRQRGRQYRARHKKPDIRAVFKDVENCSTSSRSRSATPDSLDSSPPSPPLSWSSTNVPCIMYPDPVTESPVTSPSFVQIFENGVCRNESRDVRRLPSAPILSSRELFRRASKNGSDIVASETAEGITMLGYHRIGSVRGYPLLERSHGAATLSSHDTSSDSSHSELDIPRVNISRSHGSLYEPRRSSNESLPRSSSQECLSFEEMWQHRESTNQPQCQPIDHQQDEMLVGRTWVDSLGEDDLVKLRPLIFLELTALLDSSGIRFHKRKPHKRKRKEDGLIFGVSLQTLIEKDAAISSEPHNVPLVFQKILNQLEKRGLREEGVLRVASHKQRVDRLCTELEAVFYSQPTQAEQMLQSCSVHDLAALLKRLLRDIPEPLFTNELIDLFYQSHAVPECDRALNLLVLLLPNENRATLLALISFLSQLIINQASNKMSAHNVAMIVAPSLFPPSYLRLDKEDLQAQVKVAAVSCRLTEKLLECGESLWVVPPSLIAQLRHNNDQLRYRLKENKKPMKKLLGRKDIRDWIMRKIDNEVDYQEGIVRVNAPQFLLSQEPMVLSDTTTAGDVVLKLVERGIQKFDSTPFKLGRRDIKSRALSELAPNGNLSCLLTTADPDMALATHFLYEVGGNIGQRRIEQSANMLTVYQENPNAQWYLRCDHKNGNKQLLALKN
ncbi:rho GTPase-activating protein conundrum isoform X1 [Bemisia tabaci]|uniref:rho GTPase-activating protein conundrum isoform X1 n=1 Tax=Bemisia tabaci TaxID=7038 RepID=UPI003B2880B2